MAQQKYTPFIVVSPGDIIRDNLEALNWSQDDLAQVMGMNLKSVNELINDKTAITFDSAKLLSKAFGPSPQFWINLDANYRLRAQVDTEREKDAEIKALIYRYMPIREMINKNWIRDYSSVDQLENDVKSFWKIENLDFTFLVNRKLSNVSRKDSLEQYKAYHVLTWLQMARNSSSDIRALTFKRKELQHIAHRLPEYTLENEHISNFITDLNRAGVKFLVLSHLQQTPLDGGCFKENNNPVIVYTGRYDRVSNFWLTIAHEIAHILLHLKTKDDFFVDDLDDVKTGREGEANRFALETVKADEIVDYFKGYDTYISKKRVRECSRELRIGESIIAGVLQHNGILSIRNHNKFKERVTPLIPNEYFFG